MIDFTTPLTGAFTSMATLMWTFFVYGGWIFLLFVIFWIVRTVRLDRIQTEFHSAQTPVCLHIRIERENLQSMLATEQVFAHMHAIHANPSWAQKNIEGQFVLQTGMEIVSMGGKISYIVRTYRQFVGLVEAAFYAQYPNAEITEVEDYMAGLTDWEPEKSWDMWGTELVLVKDYAYPLKTYLDFEHMAAEEKIIDPIAPLLEALGKADPHELIAVQYCIRPIADGDWVPHVTQIAKKLKGDTTKEVGLSDTILSPFNMLGKQTLFEAFTEKKKVGADGAPVAAVMKLSEGEKRTLTAVEEKMAKTGWETKIRLLYIAPKTGYDGTKKAALIGAFRTLSGMSTNNLKPDTLRTWTDHKYSMWKSLEQPYIDYNVYMKKKRFLKGFAKRSMWIGAKPYVLNTEELATLFHFPLSTTKAPPVESIDVRKGQPPANLPVIS